MQKQVNQGTGDPQDRIGALYRATRQESSPPDLDRAILAAARRAARRERLRWVVPASSAAVVLLGLSLTYHFLDDLAQLQAPEALAPARLDQGPVPAQTGGRAQRSPDSAARFAPALDSDALHQPARAPAPRATPGRSSETAAPSAVPATPEARPRARVPKATGFARMEAEEESLAQPPDQWLRQIRAHKDAGNLDAARDLLSRFLQQFPEAAIPQDLRDLMSSP